MILAGDIGGTHTRLALFEKGKQIGEEKKYESPRYPSLEKIGEEFLRETGAKVKKACFGVAGPVRDGVCKATNLPWVIQAKALGLHLSISSVFLLNDLEANAWGIKALKKEDLYVLQEGREQKGNQAIISAGTGLGEAGMFWDGEEHRPFACEGGHTDFAPRDEEEVALFLYLKKRFGHVSYERVVSGPGLCSVYQFLVETGREKEMPAVRKAMEKGEAARVVSEWGKEGKDLACEKAVDWWVSLYGAEAGNVALKFLSLGGLFVGGGIAPQLIEKLKKGPFLSSFRQKGRFQDLLSTIAIRVVMNDNAALLGAAYYAEKK